MHIETCKVSGGNYSIGHEKFASSTPVHQVLLMAFEISTTVITNAQFLAFINAGGYTQQRYWTAMGWRWLESKPVTEPAFAQDDQFNADNQPIVGVTWYEAIAYANWLSETTKHNWRLPTEIEWEAAARGHDAFEMPNIKQVNCVEQGLGRSWSVTPERVISPYGVVDMLGNVWEWTLSRWGHNWQTLDYGYPYDATDGREDLDGSHARVIRGGSYFDLYRDAHPANRGRFLPGSRASNIGFRLVKINSV